MFMMLVCACIASVSGSRWSAAKRAPKDHLMELIVAVKQDAAGVAQLEETIWAVSDPVSPAWGKHLTPGEVKELVAPSAAAFAAVDAWLGTVGIGGDRVVRSAGGDFVHVTVSVAEAEKLMPGARYTAYLEEGDAPRTVHRVADPATFSLPASLLDHVDFVEPTKTFPPKAASVKMRGRGNLKTDPSVLRDQYTMGDYEAKGNAFGRRNTQQVASFLANSYSPSDLQLFFGEYYPAGKGRTVSEVIGVNNVHTPTIEGSLDVEYIMAIGANVSTVWWGTAGVRPYPGGENEPFVTWLTAVVDGATNGTHPLSNVISVSYADEEFVVDPAFQVRADVEFMKLGAMGASLFFGSGDDGVTGDHGVCPGMQYVPWWPASSPYVTGVGATDEYNKVGASFSGGGFSNRYAIPAYQATMVAAYKAQIASGSHAIMPGMFNHSGAGFPDVCANGLQFWTIIGGIPDEVGGTSAATPTVAGIVSLLNDARLAQNKSSLGLVNPLFYAHPEVFTDILTGMNSGGGGCNGTGGYPALKGWDPVTGIGSPRFDKLLALVTSLP